MMNIKYIIVIIGILYILYDIKYNVNGFKNEEHENNNYLMIEIAIIVVILIILVIYVINNKGVNKTVKQSDSESWYHSIGNTYMKNLPNPYLGK